MTTIYVDADACPVKEEVYKVAKRLGVRVVVVANSWMRVPDGGLVALEVVSDGFDAADDWIAERATAQDVVVTGDIPLASRCLQGGARVLGHSGKPFTEASIGAALATREFLAQMREHNLMSGGPAPFSPRDRSRFLQELDNLVRAAMRTAGK
jgi:uncharacterized protein YaiI (UPF0178 family)